MTLNSSLFRAEALALHFDDGRIRALDGLDFALAEGEFVAVTGASGCGKSSLLNLIGLLDRPTAGECYFRGRAYSRISDPAAFRRQHIGFVFQSFHLIPTLSVLNNVLVPTLGAPGKAGKWHRHAGELLERLGLSRYLNRFPPSLSGGERQRTALARALINSPDILLADEPTGSLDSANAAQVLDLIGEIRRERGLAVVLVTHDPLVAAWAERRVSLRDGQTSAMAKEGGA